MEVWGLAGRGFQFGLEKADLGVALLFQAGLGLSDSLLEGMDFAAEVVELGAGSVELVVLLKGLLVLGKPFFDGRLAVDEALDSLRCGWNAGGLRLRIGIIRFGVEVSGDECLPLRQLCAPSPESPGGDPGRLGFFASGLVRGFPGRGRRLPVRSQAGPWRRSPGA